MGRNKKEVKNSIPIQFADEESQSQVESNEQVHVTGADALPPDVPYPQVNESAEESELSANRQAEGVQEGAVERTEPSAESDAADSSSSPDGESGPSQGAKTAAGPMLAELLATRAELRRVETERNDLLERLARRQADFENYRKRVERERGETYLRMVGDVVSKLLPVMDNMRRALQAESILEKNESAEFRHFLRGVELIYRQLNDALQELGVEPVPAVGQPFDPHVHEAVATEHSDEYEPDTVTQELLRGYRLGEKLLRPAMVKVSTRQ